MPHELGHPSATHACIIQSELSAIFRPPRMREIALQRLQIVARVLAKDVDQQVFLAVEVEVNRPVSDTGGAGDLGDLRVEVAALGEDVDCGAKDSLTFA